VAAEVTINVRQGEVRGVLGEFPCPSCQGTVGIPHWRSVRNPQKRPLFLPNPTEFVAQLREGSAAAGLHALVIVTGTRKRLADAMLERSEGSTACVGQPRGKGGVAAAGSRLLVTIGSAPLEGQAEPWSRPTRTRDRRW
jgi:hypothetical protein